MKVKLSRKREETPDNAGEDLDKVRSELKRQLAERTGELEMATHQLERWSFCLSHELRAPLRAIAGFSRILLEDFGSELPEPVGQHLRTMHEEACRASGLIEQLLASSPREGKEAGTTRTVSGTRA